MKTVTTLKLYEVKKHSVRYNAEHQEAAISTIYISKGALPQPFPTRVRVEIEDVEE